MSKTTIFDRLLTSTPLNTTAAKVTAGGSADDDVDMGPPPIKSASPQAARNPSFIDLTGKQYGRLTVIGLHDSKRGSESEGASWVCRCICGNWCLQKTKAVKRASPEASCQECFEKRSAQWKLDNLGSRPITDFFKPVGEDG